MCHSLRFRPFGLDLAAQTLSPLMVFGGTRADGGHYD